MNPREPTQLHVFSPYGPQAASFRTRVLQWLHHTGIDAAIHDYAGLRDNTPRRLACNPLTTVRAELLTRLQCRDLHDRVLIHRALTPFTSGGLSERLISGAKFSVYDFDDALMLNRGSFPERIWSKAANTTRSVARVDRVIAGSERLAEWAQSICGDVRLIPTCIDPADYFIKSAYEIAGVPRLLWLGSPSNEGYLDIISPALQRIHRETGARLTVISSGSAPIASIGHMIDRVEWSMKSNATLSQHDIAVAPLKDGPWEIGKCAYKILQYAAAAVPAVASPVGANLKVARDLGFPVATGIDSWTDQVLDLLRAPAVDRASIGKRAREAVDAGYSYTSWEAKWLEAVDNYSRLPRPHSVPFPADPKVPE